MGFGEHPDNTPLVLRKGESPVESLSFNVAVETGAIDNCRRILQGSIHHRAVHHPGLKNDRRLPDILKILKTEIIGLSCLHIHKGGF